MPSTKTIIIGAAALGLGGMLLLRRRKRRGLGATREEAKDIKPPDPYMPIGPSIRRSEITHEDHINDWLVMYSRNPKKANQIVDQIEEYCREQERTGGPPGYSKEFRAFMRDRSKLCIKAVKKYRTIVRVRAARKFREQREAETPVIKPPKTFFGVRRAA